MRRLIPTRTLACCVLGVSAIAMPAAVGVPTAHSQAPDGSGVERLWEEFPLEGDRSRADDEVSSAARPDATPAGAEDAEGADGRQVAPAAPAAEAPARERSEPPSTDEAERDESSIRALLALLTVVVVAAGLARVIGSSWSTPTSASPDSSTPSTPPHAAADDGAPGSKPESVIFVEGSTERDRIGEFRGFVQSTVVTDEANADLLCVEDREHERELWVRRSEIRAIRVKGGSG